MLIQLSNDRRITSDNHGYQLRKLTKVKGVDEWSGYMFFSSLNATLNAVPEQMLKESNANGWKECKAVLDATKCNILAVFSGGDNE